MKTVPQAAVAATIERMNTLASQLHRPRVQWLDEGAGNFPFDYVSIRDALRDRGEAYQYSVGWYLQQLIKLYCGRAISRRTKGSWDDAAVLTQPLFDTLVLDSDVVFFRDVAFIESAAVAGKHDRPCDATYRYAFSKEHHPAYVVTNAKLLGFEHPQQPSGVVHHMAMRGDVLADLDAVVMNRFDGKPLYVVLLDMLRRQAKPHSNIFSEYQLYFHFARHVKPQSVKLRQLYWANGPGPRSVVECSFIDRWPDGRIRPAKHADDALLTDAIAGYDYVAYHSYAKRRNCVYAPHGNAGVCFGPGCTHSCYKGRDEAKYKVLNRTSLAIVQFLSGFA